jgi:diguanylate cyclase (GGDEF)-like protein
MESSLQQLGRREWWLWFSALVVTILSGIALLLSVFPSLFLHTTHFYEIGSGQARWATFDLLLLFNGWMIYRQSSFRRMRRQLSDRNAGLQVASEEANPSDPHRIDPVTGFYTRASVEHWLGKEIARARRHNVPMSLVALHLDDFTEFSQTYGSAAADSMLKEFAIRLKKASRGTDFGARLANDGFLLVLPECSLNEAKIVLDRLGTLEMKCSGQDIALTYSVGWIDYKPGEVPADLVKRAENVLHLYNKASTDSSSPTLIVR